MLGAYGACWVCGGQITLRLTQVVVIVALPIAVGTCHGRWAGHPASWLILRIA